MKSYPVVMEERFFPSQWPRGWRGGWTWVFARAPGGPFDIVCMGCHDSKRYEDRIRCRHAVLLWALMKPWYRQRSRFCLSDVDDKRTSRGGWPKDLQRDRVVMRMLSPDALEAVGLEAGR